MQLVLWSQFMLRNLLFSPLSAFAPAVPMESMTMEYQRTFQYYWENSFDLADPLKRSWRPPRVHRSYSENHCTRLCMVPPPLLKSFDGLLSSAESDLPSARDISPGHRDPAKWAACHFPNVSSHALVTALPSTRNAFITNSGHWNITYPPRPRSTTAFSRKLSQVFKWKIVMLYSELPEPTLGASSLALIKLGVIRWKYFLIYEIIKNRHQACPLHFPTGHPCSPLRWGIYLLNCTELPRM